MKYLRAFLGLASIAGAIVVPWLFDWRAGLTVLLALAVALTVASFDKREDEQLLKAHEEQFRKATAEHADAVESYRKFRRLMMLWDAVVLASLFLLLFWASRHARPW